jgi:hypothetical protein
MMQRTKTTRIGRRRTVVAFIALTTSHALFAATPPSVPGSPGIGPLKLDDIRLSFGVPEAGPTTKFVKPGEAIPPFKAVIRYSGGGTLAGRWELASPADATTEETFILPESQMSAGDRARQGRFELLESFSASLPPLLGIQTITGPSLRVETLKLIGAYRIVLRLEEVSSAGAVATQRRLPITHLKLHMLGRPTPAPASALTTAPTN